MSVHSAPSRVRFLRPAGRANAGDPGRVAWRRASCRQLGILLVAVALGGVAGCGEGVKWDLATFPEVHARAAAADRLTFVYFRNWYRQECTDFEESVLKDPEVLRETGHFTCVPLEYQRGDQQLGQRWGLTQTPAFAVVAPDGRVLVRSNPPITKEQLLEALRAARRDFAELKQGRARTAAEQPVVIP